MTQARPTLLFRAPCFRGFRPHLKKIVLGERLGHGAEDFSDFSGQALIRLGPPVFSLLLEDREEIRLKEAERGEERLRNRARHQSPARRGRHL